MKHANRYGYQGASGVWNFGLGLPEGAVVRLQDDVLAMIAEGCRSHDGTNHAACAYLPTPVSLYETFIINRKSH